MSERRVMAWCHVSIDGYSSGPGGPGEDTWLHKHTMLPATEEYFEGIWRGCNTALMGRTNYVGFHGVWPGITADPATDPRTRDLGRWLCSVEKGVVSKTLPESEATWENTRIFRDAEEAVATLKAEPGRDILVLNSATLIQYLLAADLVDDLRLVVVPVLLGGGLRLLPEGVSVAWDLTTSTTLPNGAVGLHYQRRSAQPE
jgi:dihydrofolate reductase